MVERFRLRLFNFCVSLYFCLLCPEVFSQEPSKQYYLEKLALSAVPNRSCIYKVFKDKKIIEDCTSIGFKLGIGEASVDSVRYVFMHPFPRDELKNVQFIWTMFYLQNDLLVSTKLRVPKEERLVSDSMLSVLEGELGVLEARVKAVDVRLAELSQELNSYLNSASAGSVVRKVFLEYEKKREGDLGILLRSGSDRKENQELSQDNLKDIRGELSEQLRDIMEGRVR